MDKKQIVWLLVLAALGTFLALRFFGDRKQPPPALPRVMQTPAETQARWLMDGRSIDPARPPKTLLGSLDPDEGYPFEVELDPRGASVYTVKLTGIYDTPENKRQAEQLRRQGQLSVEHLRAWSYSLLNPVPNPLTSEDRDAQRRQGQAPTPAGLALPFSTEYLLIEGAGRVGTFTASAGTIAWRAGTVRRDENSQSVEFTLDLYGPPVAQTDPDTDAAERTAPETGPAEPRLRLVKTYTVRKGDPSLSIRLRVENQTGRHQSVAVMQFGPTGIPREDFRADERAVLRGELQDGRITVPRIETNKPEFSGGQMRLGDNSGPEPIVWGGQINRFFACLVYPVPQRVNLIDGLDPSVPATDLPVPTAQYGYTMAAEAVRENPESLTQLVLMRTAPMAVESGGAAELDLNVYCGIKDQDRFQRVVLYNRLNYTEAISFGGGCSWCTFAWLARGMMWLIQTGGRVLGNYGIAIILLVLIVRLLLHPITKKSQMNMMKFSKLGPEMEKIKQRYKDDKEAQSREMMKFMKSHGGAPILGCLPMLLQMPIWIALWQGLQAAPELRHAAFLPFWITDLAAPDAVISWRDRPIWIPLISQIGMGHLVSLNLLPLLLGVFMFLQQKLTPMTAATTASPEQRKQQKVMMYMMTGFFALIFYNMPSGLTLYMMGSIGGGVLESWVIRRHIREREAAAAAGETQVEVPGKAARGARPKKPKGPRFFRFK